MENFFPSIKVGKVYKTLLGLGFNKLTTHYITRFSTWKGEVSQGIKTSSYIANLIFRNKLKEILDIIKQSRLRINWRKTKYEGRQIVTGIQLNPSRIIAPKSILNKVEQEKSLLEGSAKPYTIYKENIDKINYSKK